MATRLLENKTRMTDPASALQATPWIPTGVLTASTVVKAVPGLLLGFTVEAIDIDGDYVIEVWDSPTADMTGDVCVVRVVLNGTTIGDMASFVCPFGPGIECQKGIYLRVVTGTTPNIILYYK